MTIHKKCSAEGLAILCILLFLICQSNISLLPLGTQNFLQGLILVTHWWLIICCVYTAFDYVLTTASHTQIVTIRIIPGIQQCCSRDLRDFLLRYVKSLSTHIWLFSFPCSSWGSLCLFYAMLFHCAVYSSPWSAIAFSGFQPWLEEVLGLEMAIAFSLIQGAPPLHSPTSFILFLCNPHSHFPLFRHVWNVLLKTLNLYISYLSFRFHPQRRSPPLWPILVPFGLCHFPLFSLWLSNS